MNRYILPFVMALTLAMIGGAASAAPSGPTVESKVPHYFGPYPNWANSPLTLPAATVTITGTGTGATAEATVGAGGSITAINVTDGGKGYSTAKVVVTGPGTGATADATIIKKGAVVDISVTAHGSGYTKPVVAITTTGAGSGATATAYGGVDAVTVTNGGSGYTAPTVNFDLPDAPDGLQARGHVASTALGDPFDGMVNGTILPNGVIVDEPGSGYTAAPGVAILNGTQFDPIALDPNGVFATATSSLSIDRVLVDTPGSGTRRCRTWRSPIRRARAQRRRHRSTTG